MKTFKRIETLPTTMLEAAQAYRRHVTTCERCSEAENALRPKRCETGVKLWTRVFNHPTHYPEPAEVREAIRTAFEASSASRFSPKGDSAELSKSADGCSPESTP